MARTVKMFSMASLPNDLLNNIHLYLKSEGYEYLQYEGEYVFKKGMGFAAGPTFFKVTFNNSTVRLEAWMKYAVTPGVYAGEIALDDFTGWAVKGPLKERFAYIESLILRYIELNPELRVAPSSAPEASLPNMRRFCNACGAQLAPGAKFCPKCGKAL